jgi:hypothetical protein
MHHFDAEAGASPFQKKKSVRVFIGLRASMDISVEAVPWPAIE